MSNVNQTRAPKKSQSVSPKAFMAMKAELPGHFNGSCTDMVFALLGRLYQQQLELEQLKTGHPQGAYHIVPMSIAGQESSKSA
ncbi:MAG: hypothetical protein AAF959_01100 [Cyanobacteria bacterium P01_D01_bin.56]